MNKSTSNDSSLLKKYGSGQPQSTDPIYIDKFDGGFTRESRAWLLLHYFMLLFVIIITRMEDRDRKQLESLDFEELESVIWRKHHLRRFFQDRGIYSHTTTAAI